MPLFSVHHHDNEVDLFSMECTTGVLNTALMQLVQPTGSRPIMTATTNTAMNNSPALQQNSNTTNTNSYDAAAGSHTTNAETSVTTLVGAYPLATTAIRTSLPCAYQRMELLPLSFVTDLLSSSKVVAALQTCAAAALSTPPLGHSASVAGGLSGRNSLGNRSSSVTGGTGANGATNTTTNTNTGSSSSSSGGGAVTATLQSVLHNIPFVGLLFAPVQLSVAEMSGLAVNGAYILLGCREASLQNEGQQTQQQTQNAEAAGPNTNSNNNTASAFVLPDALNHTAAHATNMEGNEAAMVETEEGRQGKRAAQNNAAALSPQLPPPSSSSQPNTGNEAQSNNSLANTKSAMSLAATTTRAALPSRKLSELLSEARTIGAMLSPETAGYTSSSSTANTNGIVAAGGGNSTSNALGTTGMGLSSYTCLSAGPGPAMMAAAAMVCSNTGGSAPNSAAGTSSARNNTNSNNSSNNAAAHGHGGGPGGASGHEDAFSYGPARLVTQPLPQPTPHPTITTPDGHTTEANNHTKSSNNNNNSCNTTRQDGSSMAPAASARANGEDMMSNSNNNSGRAGGKTNSSTNGQRRGNNAAGCGSEKTSPRPGQEATSNTNTGTTSGGNTTRDRSPSSGAANNAASVHVLRSVGLTGLAEEGDFGPVPLSQAASALLSTANNNNTNSNSNSFAGPPISVNMNAASVTGRFPSSGLGQNGLEGAVLHSLQQPHLLERMISLDVLWHGPRGEHDLVQVLLNEYVKVMKAKVEAVRMQWMTTYNNARSATAGAVEGRKKRGKK